MDTVRRYFPVIIENGMLYEWGVVDAKGPLAAFLYATERLTNS
jgi:acetylornithine deacetylase/succinyl-diaminopimelate desuccinylase-like protein